MDVLKETFLALFTILFALAATWFWYVHMDIFSPVVELPAAVPAIMILATVVVMEKLNEKQKMLKLSMCFFVMSLLLTLGNPQARIERNYHIFEAGFLVIGLALFVVSVLDKRF
jgi:hypothetical protein